MDASFLSTESRFADRLRVGPVEVPNRAFLAPMSGITDLPFRRMAARYGAGLVVSEMVACESAALGSEEARLRAEGEGLAIHVVQLAGRDAAAMAQGVKVAEAAGATIIDINMGCPAKRVTNGYAGSALMRDIDLALRIVEATVKAASVPVTLKMRLGWDAQSLNAPEIAAQGRSGRSAAHHSARPHPMPVLPGIGGLARHQAREGRGHGARRCQRRSDPAGGRARKCLPRPAPTL